MESKYDKKQGIDGIATLTNDPIAMDNIRRKICKGCRVKMNELPWKCGTVLEVEASGNTCRVLFDDTEESWIGVSNLFLL